MNLSITIKNLFAMGSVVLLTLLASQTYASGGFYAGVKAGKYDISVSEFDNASATGLQIGYEFSPGISIQFETMSGEGDFNTGVGFIVVNGDVEIDTMALYGVYRTKGSFFFMAKAGLLDEEVSASTPYTGTIKESETGLSAGIGAGFRIGEHFFLEAEYTLIESDVNFYGLSANVQF